MKQWLLALQGLAPGQPGEYMCQCCSGVFSTEPSAGAHQGMASKSCTCPRSGWDASAAHRRFDLQSEIQHTGTPIAVSERESRACSHLQRRACRWHAHAEDAASLPTQTKLREVAQFAGCSRLQLDAAAAEPPARAALRLQTCLPVALPPGAALPPAGPERRPAAGAAAARAEAADPFASPQAGGQPISPRDAAANRNSADRPPRSPRGAAKRAKLDPGAWAAAEAVLIDPWGVPEAHEAARAAARAAKEGFRDREEGFSRDRLPVGAGAGPPAAHWLAGAVRRPRAGLTYAPQEAAEE